MLEEVKDRLTCGGVLVERSEDEALGLRADARWKPGLLVHDAVIGVRPGLLLKGGCTDNELVSEDANGPCIHWRPIDE